MARNQEGGKSWALGSVDQFGRFGIISVFEISRFTSSAEASASQKAKTAAERARDGWAKYFESAYPSETLTVRLIDRGICDPVVNA